MSEALNAMNQPDETYDRAPLTSSKPEPPEMEQNFTRVEILLVEISLAIDKNESRD